MGCMNPLDENGVCHYCSYTDDIPHLQQYLAPRTVLNDRYIVGKMLSYNGEGASYICYDTVAKTKAVLREYMPDTLCEREMKSNNIAINADCLAKDKTYMSEFQDMNRTLTRMRNLKSICTAKDMFSENNTCYVILEYIEGVSLKRFLQSNRGYLQWSQVKKLFMPLFTTLSIIHNAGIIHRGISPENIIVTTTGELKITGFSISSIRTSGSALSPEFYSGYTAPEQYSSLEWQGTWTDVYSIAAVIYRILTGYVPPDANNRMHNDTMIPASRINQHIPRHVSNVLMRAMAVNSTERIRTINDLVSELFENVPQPSTHVKGATQTIPVVKPRMRDEYDDDYGYGYGYDDGYSEQGGQAVAKKKNNFVLTVVGFVLLAVLLIVGIFMLYQVFQPPEDEDETGNIVVTNAVSGEGDDDSEILIMNTTTATAAPEESKEESPYGTGAIMPNLIGQRLGTIERELGNSFTIRTKTYYSETDEKGIISEQSIPAGTEYDPSRMNKLTLRVCLGPPTVQVPEFDGMTKRQYLNILTDLSIIYVTQEMESYTVPVGKVIGTSLEPGYFINIQNGDVLTVYISTGIPESSSEEESSQPEEYLWDNSEYTETTTDTQADPYGY